MFERELERVADLAFQTVDATATRIARVVGFVATAFGRAAREVTDLVWDYQDLAGELRRPDRGRGQGSGTTGSGVATDGGQVLQFEPGRRANRRAVPRASAHSANRGMGS